MAGLEDYEIVRPLTTTASAGLFLGRARAGGAPVVIKRLLAVHADAEALDEMLRQEARLGARLDPAHPHVIAVLDSGEDAQGRPWLAMPYVAGVALDALLSAGGGLGAAAAARVVADAAAGVQHVHARCGVVHGDVCPANVLVGCDGVARVLDLGLARPSGAPAQAGARGRLRYKAPERLVPGRAVGSSADVYALGVALWEAVVGRSVGSGLDDGQLRAQIRTGALGAAVQGLGSERLEGLVREALALAPARRPPSAAALQAALEAWLDTDGGGTAGARASLRERLEAGRGEHGFEAVTLPSLAGHGLLAPTREETSGCGVADADAPAPRRQTDPSG